MSIDRQLLIESGELEVAARGQGIDKEKKEEQLSFQRKLSSLKKKGGTKEGGHVDRKIDQKWHFK